MATTKRSTSPARARRADIATRVLSATEELLAQGNSFTELPMQRIAEHSGVARSSLYLSFPDKSALLVSLAEEATESLFDRALDWWRADHEADGIAGVRAAIGDMVARFRAHRHVLLALSEVAAYDAVVAEYWLGRVAKFAETIGDRLRADQMRGRISADLDPAVTAQALTLAVERTISVHCRLDPGDGDERLAADLGRLIWLTVYGDAPDSSSASSR